MEKNFRQSFLHGRFAFSHFSALSLFAAIFVGLLIPATFVYEEQNVELRMPLAYAATPSCEPVPTRGGSSIPTPVVNPDGSWTCTGPTVLGAQTVKSFDSEGNQISSKTTAIGAGASNNGSCTFYNWPTQPIKCIVAPVLGGVSGLFLGLSGQILKMTAYIFDVLVTKLIVEFGNTIQGLGLIDGIHKGWSVLRDISNIVIIGMFTFIAISTIIGNESYGAKKLVANVLIVAILINFSLLFSKIIIDASNFVAFQVYKSMSSETARDSSTVGGTISGKFLSIVGATTVFDGVKVTQKISDDAIGAGDGSTLNSIQGAAAGMFYGLIGSALLLVAAGVLLYGCYLIAARAVLLVFLMLISALAFATYLVPKFAEGQYGWSEWWRSLINAAIFGPLLMLLLYVSLVILTPAYNLRTGTLGEAITNSSQVKTGGEWSILVIFIFGIGMLYISLKVANSFSHKIAGFSMASTAAMAPLMGASRLSGLVGRGVGGRFANWSFGKLQRRVTDREYEAAMGGKKVSKLAGMVNSTGLRALDSLRKGSYDPSKTRLGAKAADVTHAPKFGADWGTKEGYVGVKKRQADHAFHVAEEISESAKAAKERKRQDEAKKIRDELAKGLSGLGEITKKSNSAFLEQAKAAQGEERKILEKETGRSSIQTGGEKTAPKVERAEKEQQAKKITQEEISRNAAAEHAKTEGRARDNEATARIQNAAGKASEQAHQAVEQIVNQSSEARLAELDRLAEIEAERLAKDHFDTKKAEIEGEIKKIDSGNLKALASKEHRDRIEDAEHAGEHAAHHVAESFANQIAGWTPGAFIGDKNAAAGIPSRFKAHSEEAGVKTFLQTLAKTAGQQNSGHGPAHAEVHSPAPDKHEGGH